VTAAFISHFADRDIVCRLRDRHWDPTVWTRLPLTTRAMAFAERRHAGQYRSDGSAFIEHPLEVGSLLYYAGAPDHVIAAGVMHDLIEKTGTSAIEIRARFGPRITSLVLAVSDDGSIAGYARRKAALRRQVAHAGEEALALFAADKVSKLRELRRETTGSSGQTAATGRTRQLRARRLRHYQRSLALLEERLPESQLVIELRDELRSFLGQDAVLTGSL
jgi:(p)ppGpp synthase/HD superfamily hydrolase